MPLRRPWILLLLLGLCALLGAPGPAAATEVVWVYPLPNSLISESPVPVLGYILGSPQVEMEARVVNADGTVPPWREPLYLFKGKLFSGSVNLEPGRNNVVVGESVLPLLYRPGFEGDQEGEFRRPVAHDGGVENCTPCHGFSQGDLTLKAAPPELCLKCHKVGTESLRAITRKNKHTEEVTKDCLRCHQPHASFEAKLVRSGENVCLPCHADYAQASLHDTAGSQPCTVCHDAHASAYPNLLKGESLPMCHNCHKDVAGPPRYPRSFHRPVEDGNCFDCHLPHPGASSANLSELVPDLCTKCHPPREEGPHTGQLGECRICHTPHLSDRRGLLTQDVSRTCKACHGEFPEGVSNHPAMREGCVSCHNPHALRRGAVGSEQVCGRCHKLEDEEFRWTHGELTMPEVQQCTFCHEPHNSPYPTLLRGTVHYPLKKGGCKTCHDQDAGTLELRYQGSENCQRCHGQITGTSTVVETDKVHKPVTQVDCIACHNPHLGERENLLLEEPVTLCGWCHGIILRGVEKPHGVFAEGGTCYTCHLPHISDFRPLLKRPEGELCTRCHLEVLPEDPSLRRKVHGVVDQGNCTGCHDAHGTANPNMLVETPDVLCAGCHGTVIQGPEGDPQPFLHGPVGAGNCTACHILGHRHERRGDLFLRQNGSRICSLCHETPEGHVPNRFRAKMREVRNDCLACHNPHGADNKFLMRVGF